MKHRRVVIMDEAIRDLRKARRFYEAQMQGLGDYMFDSLIADLDSLSFYAGIHPRCFGFFRLLARRFPFAIYYDISPDDEDVRIAAILDMRRDPDTNLTRFHP